MTLTSTGQQLWQNGYSEFLSGRVGRRMYPRWLWPAFALRASIWLLILFLLPFYAVIGVAFGSVDPILFTPIPAWNPLDWNFGWVSQVLGEFAPGGVYWDVALRTIRYVVLSLAGCVLIGYPVAYYIARHAGRARRRCC